MPVGASATIYAPAKSAGVVTEGGRPAAKAEGVRLLGMEDGAAVLEVLSGHYAFQSLLAQAPPVPKADTPAAAPPAAVR